MHERSHQGNQNQVWGGVLYWHEAISNELGHRRPWDGKQNWTMQKWQYSLLSLWPAMTWLIKNDPTSVHNLDSVLILWPAMTWLMKTDPTSVHHPASVLILWPTMTWLNKNDPMSVHNPVSLLILWLDMVFLTENAPWEGRYSSERQPWIECM